MRNIAACMAALLIAALFSIQGLAQGDEYVQLTFEVQTSGDVDADATFFALYGLPQSEFLAVQLRDPDGDGNYTGNAQWMVGGKQLVVVLVQGTGTVESQFGVFPGQPVTTIKEWREPMDITKDTRFTASVKGAVTGDDQEAPDNQQDGGNLVTKTFELTLNGDVPAGETFAVGLLSELKYNEGEGELLLFCSDSDDASVPEGTQPCEGDGTTYRLSVELPAGDTLRSTFYRGFGPGPNTEVLHEVTETINADMTNTAFYTFGKGTGAGDEQDMPDNQQEGEKPDTGAGEVPDNQQEDVQDDQQGEMPEEMPETGAGGLATGAMIPVANAAAGLTMLVGAGYAVLRRR